jgi:hypothetical protein
VDEPGLHRRPHLLPAIGRRYSRVHVFLNSSVLWSST